MGKQIWKPGNMLYPLPAVMVSTGDTKGNTNILTIAWTGTVCTNPAMAYISVRPERYSYGMLRETGEFVINLTTEKLAWAADYCGVRSGGEGRGAGLCAPDPGIPGESGMPGNGGEGAGQPPYVSGGSEGGPCRRSLSGQKRTPGAEPCRTAGVFPRGISGGREKAGYLRLQREKEGAGAEAGRPKEKSDSA